MLVPPAVVHLLPGIFSRSKGTLSISRGSEDLFSSYYICRRGQFFSGSSLDLFSADSFKLFQGLIVEFFLAIKKRSMCVRVLMQ